MKETVELSIEDKAIIQRGEDIEYLERELQRAKESQLPLFYYRQQDRYDFLEDTHQKFVSLSNEILSTGLVTLERLKEMKEQPISFDTIQKTLRMDYINANGLRKGLEHIKESAIIGIIDFKEKDAIIDATARKINSWQSKFGLHCDQVRAERTILAYEITNFSFYNYYSDENRIVQAFHEIDKFVTKECDAFITTIENKAIYVGILELQLAMVRLEPFFKGKYKDKLHLNISNGEYFGQIFRNFKTDLSPLQWEVKPFLR